MFFQRNLARGFLGGEFLEQVPLPPSGRGGRDGNKRRVIERRLVERRREAREGIRLPSPFLEEVMSFLVFLLDKPVSLSHDRPLVFADKIHDVRGHDWRVESNRPRFHPLLIHLPSRRVAS